MCYMPLPRGPVSTGAMGTNSTSNFEEKQYSMCYENIIGKNIRDMEKF